MSEDIVYICNRCGDEFSLEDSERWICDGEAVTVCPNCGSDDIEEGKRCKVCRDIYHSFDMRGNVCKGCFADAVSAYKAALDSLTWEREALEDEYGNIDITEE